MNYSAITDIGKIRKNNEDSFYIKAFDDNHLLAVVADGMGGVNGGKLASANAVKTIAECVENLIPEFLDYSERRIKQALIKAIKTANKEVFQKSQSDDELNGMGTTVIVCYISFDKLYALNVGDSRLYIINDKITQITKDHSFVGELIELGVISEQQAQNHPQKNVITRALGTEEEIDADIYCELIGAGDTVLLCTDGLTNMITDETIIKICASEDDAKKAAEKLVDEAKKSGGRDNITVALIRA